MTAQLKKVSILLGLTAIISLSLLTGCAGKAASQSSGSIVSPATRQEQENTQESLKAVVYKNTEYGFDFTLPETWKDYKIITGKWEGLPPDVSPGDDKAVTGPMISIRHPLWTEENPRQDIPIMIFTNEQWNSLQKGEFHIGAAPIDPSELGHNSKYVFALPARYNYAFPTGYEEVEDILKNNPLKPVDK